VGGKMELYCDECTLFPMYKIKVQTLMDFNRANRFNIDRNFPTKNDDFFTLENHQKQLLDSLLNFERETGYSFAIFLNKGKKMIGKTSFYRVSGLNYQDAYFSIVIDFRYQNRGYGDRVLKTMIRFAFETKRLHRIACEVMPANKLFITLLEKNGFVFEGTKRKKRQRFGHLGRSYDLCSVESKRIAGSRQLFISQNVHDSFAEINLLFVGNLSTKF